MKKVVVTILLVLPFLLIFFISFTGQILSKYTYIPVERIAILDDEGDEISKLNIKLKKGENFKLRVKVFPELASNNKYTITNTNSNVCELDEENEEIVSVDYGSSTVIISSLDKHYVQCIIKFVVANEDIEEIRLSQTSITVPVGTVSREIGIQIVPKETLQSNRGLVFEVEDETIASINEKQKIISGLKVGTTTITIRSNYRPEVFATLTVNVVDGEIIKRKDDAPLRFDIDEEINLCELIETNPSTLMGDVKFKIVTSYGSDELDVSKFVTEQKLKFKKGNVLIRVEASVTYNGETHSIKFSLMSNNET